jgi:hypothetical protein
MQKVKRMQQLRTQREKLEGWRQGEERDDVGRTLRAMSKSLDKDPAMGSALVRRASQLGLGRQWPPEWSAPGMVRELTDQMKACAVGIALCDMLGRERGSG